MRKQRTVCNAVSRCGLAYNTAIACSLTGIAKHGAKRITGRLTLRLQDPSWREQQYDDDRILSIQRIQVLLMKMMSYFVSTNKGVVVQCVRICIRLEVMQQVFAVAAFLYYLEQQLP